MPVSRVGAGTPGTTSADLSGLTILAGDIILAFAFRDGSTTVPTLATGYTQIQGGGTNTCASRLCQKVAVGGETSTGAFANATGVVAVVYRGCTVGASAQGGGASTSVTYPALTLQQPAGASWVAGFGGHRSVDTTLETAPTGMANRSPFVDATNELAAHDTGAGVTSWAATAVSVGGTSSGWRAATVELVETATAPEAKVGSESLTVVSTETSATLGRATVSETATVALTDVAAVSAPVTATDSVTLTLGEAVAVQGTTARTDPATVAFTEAVAALARPAVADATTVALTEAVAVLGRPAASDTATVGLTDAASIIAAPAASDTLTATAVEAAATAGTAARAEALTLSLAESVAALARAAASDGLAVTLAESAAASSAAGPVESLTLGLTEAAAILVRFGTDDEMAITLGEFTRQIDPNAPPPAPIVALRRNPMLASVGRLM